MQTHTIESIAEEFGITLEACGDEYRCVCPVHDDTNPSLYINPAKQKWICFGCGHGGGLVRFYSFVAGCSVAEAILKLGSASVLASYLQQFMLKRDEANPDVTAYVLRELLADAEDTVLQSKLIAATLQPQVSPEDLIEVVVNVV